MAQDEWSVLYARVRTPVYERIKAAAAADDRAVAKWIEIHFRDFFEKADAQCDSTTSSPDISCAFSESGSSPLPPE